MEFLAFGSSFQVIQLQTFDLLPVDSNTVISSKDTEHDHLSLYVHRRETVLSSMILRDWTVAILYKLVTVYFGNIQHLLPKSRNHTFHKEILKV